MPHEDDTGSTGWKQEAQEGQAKKSTVLLVVVYRLERGCLRSEP